MTIELLERLQELSEQHLQHTGSPRAKRILDDWDMCLPMFVKVMPIDYRAALERIRLAEDAGHETVSASEEVFHG